MAIVETDIKLMASERLYDTDDGGGGMTGNEVVDGEENNLFPDISELDRTYGDVALRKAFASVRSSNTEVYYGANAIVSKPPTDENVGVLIFKTGDSAAYFNERSVAQNKIESYVTKGVLSSLKMYGNHYSGQKSLFAYQTESSTVPAAGDVFCLNDGTNEQFVRIQSITYEIVIYTDSVGDFTRRECNITLSDALQYDFEGGEPNRYTSYQPTTKIYKTNAVDAVNYYGIAALSASVASGAMQIVVEDYKRPLVPSTQSESSLLDIQAGGTKTLSFANGDRTVSVANVAHTAFTKVTASTRQYNYVQSLSPLPAAKTLEIYYRAAGHWYTVSDEDGSGVLSGDGSGRINYTTGSVAVTLKDLPDVDTLILWAWATKVHYTIRTLADVMDYQWEGQTAHAPVVPGTITITWEYPSGTVKTVTDADSDGVLQGAGSGSINYTTGKFNLKPNIIPSGGTTPQIAYQYGEQITETISADIDGNGDTSITLANQIKPGTLSLEWVVERTKTKSEATSNWDTGSGSSSVTGINYYSSGSDTKQSETSTILTVRRTAKDNGNGVLKPDACEGTVNYATGEVAFNTTVEVYCTYTTATKSDQGGGDSGSSGGSDTTTTSLGWPTDPISVKAVYMAESGSPSSVSGESIADIAIKIDLTPYTSHTIVPGSVEFTIGSTYYVDIEGKIYRGTSCAMAEVPGTESGTIDYDSGIVTLTDWTGGVGASSFDLKGLVTVYGTFTCNHMWFHTPGAPLKPGGFYLNATDVEGNTLTGSTDTDGTISGDHLKGTVDIETGIVKVEFGDSVLATSLTDAEKAESWYDADDIDEDGYIWKPRMVIPSTVRYNTVCYVYLPLSEEILGLDPVRLPEDGRVPIFRVGDVVVIHYTGTISVASPTVNQVIDTEHTRLAYAKLYDGNGDAVDTDYYSVDLDAGTVTLLTVTGLTTPLSLEWRIEDMRLVSDVQIDGTLTLTKALSRAFPSGSFCSSALVIGDLYARVSECFSQATWTSVWSDEQIGSDTDAQFNDTVYPIAVTNKGCLEERWAIIFTSATTFKCIGEYTGQIASGQSINEDFAPENPNAGVPYFTLRAAGWGSGWATGNVLRINTKGANFPIWIARTVLQSDASSGSDQFRMQIRGDVDTES